MGKNDSTRMLIQQHKYCLTEKHDRYSSRTFTNDEIVRASESSILMRETYGVFFPARKEPQRNFSAVAKNTTRSPRRRVTQKAGSGVIVFFRLPELANRLAK